MASHKLQQHCAVLSTVTADRFSNEHPYQELTWWHWTAGSEADSASSAPHSHSPTLIPNCLQEWNKHKKTPCETTQLHFIFEARPFLNGWRRREVSKPVLRNGEHTAPIFLWEGSRNSDQDLPCPTCCYTTSNWEKSPQRRGANPLLPKRCYSCLYHRFQPLLLQYLQLKFQGKGEDNWD